VEHGQSGLREGLEVEVGSHAYFAHQARLVRSARLLMKSTTTHRLASATQGRHETAATVEVLAVQVQ
jgi:hypothetical protein